MFSPPKIGILELYDSVPGMTFSIRSFPMSTENPSIELIKTLVELEQAGIPLDDFGNSLLELSMVDQYTHIDLHQEFGASGNTPFGLHGINHTIRVVFWVLYLVEISNRQGYPINEEEALAAMYAALVHDLSRKDDLPGGQHGKDAASKYRNLLGNHLSPQLLERCLTAVEWHGYSEDPIMPDPVWMLLKDADALDRARLSPPGMLDGCDPSRLRLTVLKENTPIMDACLTMSLLLTALLTVNDARKSIFRDVTLDFVDTLLSASTGQSESLQQAVHLITDRFQSA
jgi:hypothetical protein